MASSHLAGGRSATSAAGDRLRLGVPLSREGASGSEDEKPVLLFFSGVFIAPIVAEGIAYPRRWNTKARARGGGGGEGARSAKPPAD